ncbi:MAG: hypothetical protein IT249_19380 [Chitinophagaceae bacterium]|nr:hypothetical protein [Chitinophagaceae bacterium]
MQRKKPDVDIVSDILKAALEARPDSTFVKSLAFQYEERGSLSKKQLEGLFHKASKINTIPDSKLTTLEAIIKKKPTKFKSAPPKPTPLYTKDEATGKMIDDILSKYPQHKMVLFLKAKYNNNETLSASEIGDLQRFSKLLKK